MNEYKVYRVETDARVVASVVVACCKQDERFYAEYLVLLPHLDGCRSWYSIEETTEAKAKAILQDAWNAAYRRIASGELCGIFKGNHADGDASDFEGYFIPKYRNDMDQLRGKVKCQCLKDLLR